jgi:DNA sulfur modification protein DndD
MLLRRITLNNFGTYAGSQTLNLATQPEQPVVLIGGKNGAGKSTLLEAIRLCFYGQSADKLLTTRERYERYLLGRMHRGNSIALPTKHSFVEIEFDYADENGLCTYTAKRAWERKPVSGVAETFDLMLDGEPVRDIDPAHWQEFIQELIPLGVSDLFFFDGEKVQLLAEDESDRTTLSEAVKNLLGTNIIEKLDADMSIYRSRALQNLSEEANAPDLDVLLTSVDVLRRKLAEASESSAAATSRVEAVRVDIGALEQKIQEKGGGYAKDHGKLEERKRQLASRVSQLESIIREHAQGLLPIALAPKLLREVISQLDFEQDLRVQCVLEAELNKAARSSIARLKKLPIKRGNARLPLAEHPEFGQIAEIIKSSHRVPEIKAEMIHDLSNAQDQQIRLWTTEALNGLPLELSRLAQELEQLYREQQKVERDLARIPADEVLQPYLEQLRALNQSLSEALVDSLQLQTAWEKIRGDVERAEVAHQRGMDKMTANSARRSSITKAEQVQQVLSEFKKTLVERKLKEVEVELSKCFSSLSRKRIERTITINPSSFQVSIRDNAGRIIAKEDLSAGEKQIYAISVLWALGKVSGRPLPIIIDTPLARLDREHRALLGKRYFPKASHQVIVLSTDTEVDNDFLPLLGDSVARKYELSFEFGSQSTLIKEGYFEGVPRYEAV